MKFFFYNAIAMYKLMSRDQKIGLVAVSVTAILLLMYLLAGCSSSKKVPIGTLHNYPILEDEDCPVDLTNYDEDEVRKRAKELNMRPVDYLHYINNKKHRK